MRRFYVSAACGSKLDPAESPYSASAPCGRKDMGHGEAARIVRPCCRAKGLSMLMPDSPPEDAHGRPLRCPGNPRSCRARKGADDSAGGATRARQEEHPALRRSPEGHRTCRCEK